MSKKEKLVSFVVPVYKTEPYLEKCLKSLQAQDYKNCEIIVVLDGPSDEAREIIKKFTNPPQVFEIEHGGVQKARNFGFTQTSGDYISFWDSDCYAEPGMVRMWVKVFEREKDISFIYSDYRFNTVHKDAYISEPFNPYLLTSGNYIATMFPMKREVFPGFDESLKSLQDWDFWLSIVEKGGKGYYLQGSAFETEVREGISAEGCSDENWLERYKKVREKHGITGRDVCFTSVASPFRAKDLAQMFQVDFSRNPGYHPNEYKKIICIGFYPSQSLESSEVFKKSPKDCKHIIHWLGEDAEAWLMQPYRGVKHLVYGLNQTGIISYAENTMTQDCLKELGIESVVAPLPMVVKDVPLPDKFRIYYEYDGMTKPYIDELIKACPDMEFVEGDMIELKDFACFLSITNSVMPSENLKRFVAGGRYVVSSYRLPYAGYVEADREKIIRKLREAKRDFIAKRFDLKGKEYYINLLSPETYKKEVING